MTKIGNSNSTMTDILNSVYRTYLACYCVYVHEIWHVDSFYDPTYELTIILNKNKIQDGGSHHLAFLHKHQYLNSCVS